MKYVYKIQIIHVEYNVEFIKYRSVFLDKYRKCSAKYFWQELTIHIHRGPSMYASGICK